MLKKIIDIIRKVVMSVLFIYAYNKLALPIDFVMPINAFTVLLVTMCGIPSILMLVLFSIICV